MFQFWWRSNTLSSKCNLYITCSTKWSTLPTTTWKPLSTILKNTLNNNVLILGSRNLQQFWLWIPRSTSRNHSGGSSLIWTHLVCNTTQLLSSNSKNFTTTSENNMNSTSSEPSSWLTNTEELQKKVKRLDRNLQNHSNNLLPHNLRQSPSLLNNPMLN